MSVVISSQTATFVRCDEREQMEVDIPVVPFAKDMGMMTGGQWPGMGKRECEKQRMSIYWQTNSKILKVT